MGRWGAGLVRFHPIIMIRIQPLYQSPPTYNSTEYCTRQRYRKGRGQQRPETRGGRGRRVSVRSGAAPRPVHGQGAEVAGPTGRSRWWRVATREETARVTAWATARAGEARFRLWTTFGSRGLAHAARLLGGRLSDPTVPRHPSPTAGVGWHRWAAAWGSLWVDPAPRSQISSMDEI